MVTATETPKRKSRTKSQNDAPPVDETAVADAAGQQVSTDPSDDSDIDRLSARLKSFGFDVPIALIGQWDGPTFTQIELTASRWQNEFERANNGEAIREADRTPIPEKLTEYGESIAPEYQRLAQDAAIVSATAGYTPEANPYPLGSGLALIWVKAFDEARPQTVYELSKKREEDRAAEFALQQQRAIEDAQEKIESALEQQQIAKSEWNRLKKRLKSVKQDYDDAVEEAQEGYGLLRDARDGNLPAQRQLPFKDEKAKPSVPDVNVKATGEIVPAPVVDNGAAIPLDHLIKKEFAEYFDTDNELGISAKQMEEVKKVAGETIGSLETWLNANGSGEWGWKNLADKVEGVGKATIDKLREAYLFARGKYPMPDPTETRETATEQPTSDASLTAEEALTRLDALVESCESLAETCESDDGVEFLTSVGEQASSMRETIEEHENVTADQSRAIVNWEAGVAKWDKGEPIGTTEGTEEVDDLEEDLE